jgi:hypothetical protein
MSTISAEQYQTLRSQHAALPRPTSNMDEAIRLSHLLQAPLVRESRNSLRQAVTAHWDFVRNIVIAIVILLSVAFGWLAPQIVRALWAY